MTTKKYKLLKDLPFANAGVILDRNEYNCWFAPNADDFSWYREKNQVGENLRDFLDKLKDNTDWFEPIIKKPKQILKYANGAVMENLEVDQQYYSINSIMAHQELWGNHICDATRCMQRNVFLTQLEAQRALNMQIVQNWLLKKIAEIDANNNWACDWSDINQKKYFLSFDHDFKELDKNVIPNTGKYANREYNSQTNNVYMSEQAKDYMMSDKVSLEDFKLFLNVVN